MMICFRIWRGIHKMQYYSIHIPFELVGFVMFSLHVCWQIIDKSKRDCREEVEILLRYGQTHHYIVSLRWARKTHNRLFKDQKICQDLNFVKDIHATIKHNLKRASNFQISTGDPKRSLGPDPSLDTPALYWGKTSRHLTTFYDPFGVGPPRPYLSHSKLGFLCSSLLS